MMSVKNISFAAGAILVFIALVTVFPNTIIGEMSFFHTDFAHNLIHFLSGVAILFVALQYERFLGKTLRALGMFYLALAVLGAITVGSASFGAVFGFVGMSGADHILHLIIGIILVALGTKEIRIPLDDVAEDDLEEEYNPLTH